MIRFEFSDLNWVRIVVSFLARNELWFRFWLEIWFSLFLVRVLAPVLVPVLDPFFFFLGSVRCSVGSIFGSILGSNCGSLFCFLLGSNFGLPFIGSPFGSIFGSDFGSPFGLPFGSMVERIRIWFSILVLFFFMDSINVYLLQCLIPCYVLRLRSMLIFHFDVYCSMCISIVVYDFV